MAALPSRRAALGWRIALLAVLLLAAGLRFYRLDAQSFWNDEGNTARLVERPVRLIIEGAAGDIHPPGYYLLLHAWRACTGETEFALRGFSALCGVLMVALTAAIGKRVGGWRVALASALFVAAHPLAVYYSQEARMYALLGALSAATVLVALALEAHPAQGREFNAKTPRRKDAEGFILPRAMCPVPKRVGWRVAALAACVALGLYTQYAYLFVVVGINLAYGVAWITRRPWRWRAAFLWALAHALGGLAFLPWSPIALRASGWRPPDLDAARAFGELTRTLAVGLTLPASRGQYVAPLLLILLGVALLVPARSRRGAWLVAGAALTPPALLLLLGIYRPAYLKFLMASLAPLAVLLALPLAPSRRRYALFAMPLWVALLALHLMGLRHLYYDPAYARDDYRGMAASIAAEGRPGDAILLSAPNQWEVFTYYYRGDLPVYPAPYRPTAADAEGWVADIVTRHTRLFVLFWGDGESDPERHIEVALARRAYKAGERWVDDVRLARYGAGPLPDAPTSPGAARLGDAITLAGYALPAERFAPGDVIPLTLFWDVASAPAGRYTVFVHLMGDAEGLVAQTDAEPQGGFYPTHLWAEGERVIDRYGVLLPDDLAPGRYTLLVGMYDAASGARLPIPAPAVEDALPLVEITVAR